MRKFAILTLLVVVTLSKTTASKPCTSLLNIKVNIYPDESLSNSTTINIDSGCLQGTSFENTIFQAEIKNQNVTRLGQDSVRNLSHLQSVYIRGCPTSVLEPGVFRNVPRLKRIYFNYLPFTELPHGVFTNAVALEFLDVSYNKIRSVEDGGFGGMPLLRKLYCKHNDLMHYDPTWFYNMTNLELIDFSFNKIKRIPSEGFVHLKKINNIYFDYNDLEIILPDAFKGVTKIVYVGLKYNKLKTLDASMFPNEIVIEDMRIDANHLNFLPKKLMDTIVVKKLYMNGNPWKCPCLDKVLLWLYLTNGSVAQEVECLRVEVPVCSVSSVHSRTCTEVVDDEVTGRFLDQLSRLRVPLHKYCARLD